MAQPIIPPDTKTPPPGSPPVFTTQLHPPYPPTFSPYPQPQEVPLVAPQPVPLVNGATPQPMSFGAQPHVGIYPQYTGFMPGQLPTPMGTFPGQPMPMGAMPQQPIVIPPHTTGTLPTQPIVIPPHATGTLPGTLPAQPIPVNLMQAQAQLEYAQCAMGNHARQTKYGVLGIIGAIVSIKTVALFLS
ncbi:hypothetical protein H0H93_013651 [Arthromyces matolae]|nr:hypothetical protein H0H93_013651 [Arthromyces matolae]